MLLDAGPAILILSPVLGPTFVGLDVDSLHFAIIMCVTVTVTVTVGLATPPMDLVLFVAASLSGGSGWSGSRWRCCRSWRARPPSSS